MRQIGQPVPIGSTLPTQVAQKRAWPHETSVTPSRCPIRHTSHSQQLSTATAGVAADVEVVPVAAAGNAVPTAGRLRHLLPLEDSLWRGYRASVCSLTLTHGASTIRNRTVKRISHVLKRCSFMRFIFFFSVSQASELICFDFRRSSNRSKSRPNRLLNLFSLRRLPLLS